MRSFIVLIAFSFAAAANGVTTFDLADVVGGGDGTGTGTVNTGIDPRTGNVVVGITSTNNPGASNVYNAVAHAFVDGVFVPDGGGGAVQVTSTGITAALPNTDGQSWENGMGYNAGCCGGNLLVGGAPTAFPSWIGFHSNKGITFDLDAIRAANPGMDISQYTATVGLRAGSGSAGDIGHIVLVDGVVAQQDLSMLPGENATNFSVAINSGDRFLTLVGVAGPDQNYSFDQGIIALPTLHLVPEPVTASLFVMGAMPILLRRRRSA